MKEGNFKTISCCLIILKMLFLLSCSKENTPRLSDEEIKHKVDSIFNIKKEKMEQEAAINLDRRLPIELKPLVDSILNRKDSVWYPDNRNYYPSLDSDYIQIEDSFLSE